jgi:hypothetical protein
MTSDELFHARQRRHDTLWCFGALFVLPLSLFLMQQAGPGPAGPAIVISRETTYITEPLKPNGLPDYEQYVLKLFRVEVKPEENAAVLLWHALWPGDLESADYEPLCRELGFASVPTADTALKSLRGEANQQRILKWFKERGHSNVTPDAADALCKHAVDRPWQVADFPPLEAWVRENRSALAKISAATRKPKFYSPSPSLLNDIDEPLAEMTLPGPLMVREAAKSLCVRAMGYCGEGDIERAWQDILGCHRLARWVAGGPSMEQIVAFAISDLANHATLALLGRGRISAIQAERIRGDIQSLVEFGSLVDSYNTFERLKHLDLVLMLRSGKPGIWQKALHVPDNLLKLARVPADWNIALSRGNEFYDHLVTVVQMPPGRARDEAVYEIHDDLDRLPEDFPRRARPLAQLNERDLGDLHARATVALFAPHLDSVLYAHERANTKLHLLRLVAALAVYRAEVGAYPDKLDDLVPRVLEKLPVDLYGTRPFVYRRDAEGYLLYSVGRDGTDDGGSNARTRTFEGRRVDELDEAAAANAAAKMPVNSDDISVRVPRPPLELPLPPSRSE